MEGGGPHPGLAQGRHLVVHQGDQGRDHHAGAGAAEGRDLITEGFAAAGGHQHQGRATAHHMADDLGLGSAKGPVTKHLGEDLEGIGGWGRGDRRGRGHGGVGSTRGWEPRGWELRGWGGGDVGRIDARAGLRHGAGA